MDAREDIPALVTEGRGRRLLLILGGVALVLAAAAVVGWMVWARQRDARVRRVGKAWDAFERCLIGGPPGPGQTASDLMRRIELKLWHVPENVDPQRGVGWPRRCEIYAQALYELLKKVDLPDKSAGEKLGLMAYGAVGVLKTGHPPTNADELWAVAARAGVPRVRGPAVTLPPEPVQPRFRRSDLLPLGAAVNVDWVTPGPGREVLLLSRRAGGERSEQLLCTVGARGPARCRVVPRGLLASPDSVETVERRIYPPDSDDQPPAVVLVAQAGADSGIYDIQRKQRMWADPGWEVRGLFSRGIGFTLVAETDKGWVTQAFQAQPFDINPGLDLIQVGEWLLAVEPAVPGVRVTARRMGITGLPDEVLRVTDVAGGSEPEVSRWTFAERCRSAEATLAIVAAPWGAETLLVGDAAGWKSAPLPGQRPDGHLAPSCRGRTLSFLARRWGDGGEQWIDHHTCSETGCVRESGQEGLPGAELALAGDLVVGAWAGEDERLGERGAVWLRMARAGELARTPDVLLTDGAAYGGISGLVRALHGVGDAAIVMLEDAADDQAYLVRVRGDGGLEPVGVEMVP